MELYIERFHENLVEGRPNIEIQNPFFFFSQIELYLNEEISTTENIVNYRQEKYWDKDQKYLILECL